MVPLPANWLAARIADLTPDLQLLLSWGSTVASFCSRQSFSNSFFHVSLGLPVPHLPSICISHAVLNAPLEISTCPNQRSLLSLKMSLRSSSSSFASISLDLTVATSSGLILQICLIMALSLRCKPCRFVLVLLIPNFIESTRRTLQAEWNTVSTLISWFISCSRPTWFLFVWFWGFMSQSTAMFMSRLSSHLTTLFPGAGLRKSSRYVSDCWSRGHEFNPGPVQYFCGDWSWNHFYCHSPPFHWFKKGCCH